MIDWVVDSNKLLNSKKEMVTKSFLVCGISNAWDGSQNDKIRCAKELPDMLIAYGLDKSSDNSSESDDPFSSESDDSDEENDPEVDQPRDFRQ